MKYELKTSVESQKTIDDLKQQGIFLPMGTDVDMPKLPPDITQLSDEDLMELFTSLTSFLDFVNYQIALAEIEEKAAERKLDVAIALSTANQPKGLAAVIKAAALADPKVIELSETHSIAYNYRKLISTMGENFNRDMVLVSRELTRRTSDGSSMVRSRKFIT